MSRKHVVFLKDHTSVSVQQKNNLKTPTMFRVSVLTTLWHSIGHALHHCWDWKWKTDTGQKIQQKTWWGQYGDNADITKNSRVVHQVTINSVWLFKTSAHEWKFDFPSGSRVTGHITWLRIPNPYISLFSMFTLPLHILNGYQTLTTSKWVECGTPCLNPCKCPALEISLMALSLHMICFGK